MIASNSRGNFYVDNASEIAERSLTDWDCLRGQILDSRFEVGDLLQPDRGGAWFQAHDLTDASQVLLFLEDEAQPGALEHFDRFREAAFLDHPNLARVLAAGRAVCEHRNFIFLATETAEMDLAEELQRGPMSPDEAAELLRQMAAALAYLHSENLTSCAVRAGAIWRVNSRWKLGDYTQLRVPGQYPPRDTRRLMLIPAFECPPEANDGLVSTAWDVWSVGSLLRKVFPRSGRAQSVPAPFDAIVRRALDPDPESRPTLDAMLKALTAIGNSTVEELLPPAAIEPDVEPESHQVVESDAAPDESDSTEKTTLERPLHQYAAVQHQTSGPNRIPIIAGAVLAAAIAAILAFTLPTRMLHPTSVQPNAVSTETAPNTAAVPSTKPAADSQAPTQAQTASQQPASQATPPSPLRESATSSAAAPGIEKEITSVLTRWAYAKRRRNVDEEMDCYAPSVDRFYGQRGLTASQLKREEQNIYSRIGAVQRFEIANVKFDRVNPEWAVVSFDKKWDFQGRTRFAGSSREELVLRPVRGRWKISSQREVKVYWVSKNQQSSKPS